MKKCSICTKKNDRGSGPFFNVPKDENRRRLWSDICKREFAPHDRICVDHFSPSYIIKGNLKSMLLPCAVPFINLNPIKDVQSYSISGQQKNQQNSVNKSTLSEPTVKILPVKKKFTHCTTPTEERDPLDTSSSSLEQNNDHPVQKVLLKKDPRLSAKIPLKLTQCPGGKITLAPAVRSEKQCSSPEDTANKNPQSTDKIPMKKISKVTSDKTIESKVSGNITQTLQVEFVDMDYVKPSPVAAKKQTRYSTKYNLKKIANLTNKAPMDKLTQCSGGRVTLTPREEHDNDKSVDSETQTDAIILECTTQMQNDEYRRTIRKLQMEIKDLRVMLNEATTAVNTMRAIFTEGQLRKLLSPQSIQWRWEDISHAIFQHQTGPRAYGHLYKKGYPLPSLSTLQRWCRTFDVNEGFLSTSIDFLKHNTELVEEDKICVLAFDEMTIEDPGKPPKCVQVVIARGLRKSWKQPVFYNYDCEMRKDTLCCIISKLKEAGFPVVGLVCDMNEINNNLWEEFKVTVDQPWFPNPANPEHKIFVFANASHLLKLIRNQFLDTGLMYNDVLIKADLLTEILKYNSTKEKKLKCELTDEHFAIEGRENLKFATDIFSKTTAFAIRRCPSLRSPSYKSTETADFIQLMNDWFDIMNSTIETINKPGKEPYGSALASQENILERINEIMSTPIIPNYNDIELFQIGVIITNNSLQMLHSYLKEHYMDSILTERLSKDVVEDFVKIVCIKDVNPTTKEFKHRLRRYILARNTEQLYGCVEVKSTTTECLNTATDNNTQPSNNEILITVTIENNEQLEKSHDDIDLNDLIAIQELSGGMFDHILERSTEDLHNTEKSDNIEKLDNVKKDTPPNKKRKVDDTAAVKMGLGNVHVPVDLDPLEAAHLTDWAANFNSSLLGPSTPPHSSDMPTI